VPEAGPRRSRPRRSPTGERSRGWSGGNGDTISLRDGTSQEAFAMRLLIAALTLIQLGLGQPAAADQDDPRLDELFGSLVEAPTAEEAQRIEAEIWSIWQDIDDSSSARLLRQGNAAMAKRVFPIAIVSFNRLVDRSPEFAEGWNRRATLHYLMGNDEASIRDIEQVLALEPRHFGALSGLGLIMLRNERPAAALRSFEAALEVHPYLPAARVHLERLREIVEGEPT
jgi:tetratricopeptide (TPR) repeat protein